MRIALQGKQKLLWKSWAAVFCLIAGWSSALAQSDGITQAPLMPFDKSWLLVPPHYNERLLAAPPVIKSKVKAIQDEIRQTGYTYSVGYTEAMDYPLEILARLTPPRNLLAEADKQNAFVKEAQTILGTAAHSTLVIKSPTGQTTTVRVPGLGAGAGAASGGYSAPANCTAAKVYDLRPQGVMTPVRNQGGNCGSCWAFSAMGTFEAAYSARNRAQIDASEQHVLNCSGAGTCANGGWYHNVFKWMLTHGVADEAAMPYKAQDFELHGGRRHAIYGGALGICFIDGPDTDGGADQAGHLRAWRGLGGDLCDDRVSALYGRRFRRDKAQHNQSRNHSCRLG